MTLDLTPRAPQVADAIFERLTAMQDGLTPDQAAAANARLVLILAQHIGDLDLIEEAIRLVRSSEGSI